MFKKLLVFGAVAFFVFGSGGVGYVSAQIKCGSTTCDSATQGCLTLPNQNQQCVSKTTVACGDVGCDTATNDCIFTLGVGSQCVAKGAGGGNSGGGTTPGVSIKLINPLGNDCNFPCLVGRITNLFLDIAAPIAVIMVLIGGFIMATSAGDPEKFKKGQKTLLYSAIGLAVILAAQSIPALIKNILGS